MSFDVTRGAGRLVLARVRALATVQDVDRYARAFAPFRAHRPRAIVCADHRPVTVYSPDVAERLATLFTDLNDVWERAVVITSTAHAVLTLQLQRIIASSENPLRRVVTDPGTAIAFLGPLLSPDEATSLRAFLDVRESIGARPGHRRESVPQ